MTINDLTCSASATGSDSALLGSLTAASHATLCPDDARVRRAFAPADDTLVSIVMPAFNAAELLRQSVASVCAQTYPHWELLLIDDASKDGTLQRMRELAAKEPRIRVFPLAANGGIAHARNVGIGRARGRYLAFLDSDDLWLPQKLAVQVEFMRRSNAAFTFTAYRRMGPGEAESPVLPAPAHVSYSELLRGNVIGCLTAMIDRQAIPSVCMPALRHEDYRTWLGILREGHVAHGIAQDLARYRVSGKQVSHNKLCSACWTWAVYRDGEGLPLGRALACFLRYLLRGVSSRLHAA